MQRGERGFTLIELLIVVAIIGLIAAMAIPNLISAIDRSRQKTTMADLRTLGSVVEMYAVDNNTYPRVGNYSGLTPLIEPIYIKSAPAADGWSHSWVFQGDTNTGREYSLISYAKDGIPGPVTGGTTNDFNCDIVFSSGQFFQWPAGTQQ